MTKEHKPEPRFEIKTEHQEITMFIDLGEYRISAKFEDFQGQAAVQIKKHRLYQDSPEIEEEINPEYTLAEIQALQQLLAAMGSFYPQTHNKVSFV
jgi:hypothetical protein